ncbi:hypothetical protein ACIPJN_39350 [Streptomyces sp. NPDC086796]|uniref:hypothetical protein n=1 Tax=Streptomyces sp. NPDC086796 TaxID=3365760 RepID=UPI0038007660
MTADAPLMTPDQMLRALDYVEAAWSLDVDAMDRLDQESRPPIRYLLADVLHLLVLSAGASTAADDGPSGDHAAALGTVLVRAVGEWAETAEPDVPDDAGDGVVVVPDYRHADMGIARTVATYVLEVVGGEPGDLSGRLAPIRAEWSVARAG